MLEMNQNKCLEVSSLLKAVAHPGRLQLLCHLVNEEHDVGSLTEFCSISQSQMSQFLGRMQREGILSSRKEGGHTYYSIRDKKVIELILALHKIFLE